MLTVNTYLAPSSVHGIGLFAAEFIPAGTTIWKYHRSIDKIFKKDEFLALCNRLDCSHSLRHLLNSSYNRGGRFFYLTDNARFINHSKMNDNICFVDDYTEIAMRDINPHEEFLENYLLAYDKDDFFFQELMDPDPYHYISTLQMPGFAIA